MSDGHGNGCRLSDQPDDAYLSGFESQRLTPSGDGTWETEITVGDHEILICIYGDPDAGDSSLLNTTKKILRNIVGYDAAATAEINDTEEDGELACLHVLSHEAFDLEYYARSWNSNWDEMFVRAADGSWSHCGVRTNYPRPLLAATPPSV